MSEYKSSLDQAEILRLAILRSIANPSKPTPPSLASLFGPASSPQPSSLLGLLGSMAAMPPALLKSVRTPRKVFFSFHYDDIIRVNNVRNIREFQDGTSIESQAFYDRSLWESSKRANPESLKQLIREGIKHSSVVCVLIGRNTWERPWVRYEIGRSVIENKGLLAVDLNGVRHHRDLCPDIRGPNPLDYMAVGKMHDGTFRLFEFTQSGWVRYGNYLHAVSLPHYLPMPQVDYVTPLSRGTIRYDFAQQQGAKNLGAWTSLAATMARR
ncbi:MULTISPECIES: TIR domain-containing protein [unclassified Mesorhizobium]|uniref:TIR domain-containing protein n=1 Tax=unclassified Mesorhizobium TaxID=325217 RepID=UPI003014E499